VKVTLSLTHRCNLACRYCYSGRARKPDMSLATAEKIVDFALGITPSGQSTDFCFFGGEPFLCFDLMKDITAYIREQQRARGKSARLSVTTNGTILTRSILDFVKQENVGLCISIDGPAHVHDLNRCWHDGRGSFAQVVHNLQVAIAQLERVQVNAVYGPETLDFLPESVSFLTQLGASAIHLNSNICASWPKGICSKLQECYMQLADHYIECYQRQQEIALNLIDNKVILFWKGGYGAEDLCGMGETEWGFAPSGNIYPCERLIGEDNDGSLCLGNIHTGLSLERRCSLLEERGNHNMECKTCGVKDYCMNWCGCTNYYLTGHTDLAGSMLCASERAAMKAAQHVAITLSEQANDLFADHFMRYLYEGRNHP
jgi:uncharacterized protein